MLKKTLFQRALDRYHPTLPIAQCCPTRASLER
jgi:hypothetical protein